MPASDGEPVGAARRHQRRSRHARPLMRAFVENRIKPYYLHHGDLAPGTGPPAHHPRSRPGPDACHARPAVRAGAADLRPRHPGGYGKVPVGPSYLAGGEAGWTVTDPTGATHAYPPRRRRRRHAQALGTAEFRQRAEGGVGPRGTGPPLRRGSRPAAPSGGCGIRITSPSTPTASCRSWRRTASSSGNRTRSCATSPAATVSAGCGRSIPAAALVDQWLDWQASLHARDPGRVLADRAHPGRAARPGDDRSLGGGLGGTARRSSTGT